MQDPLSAERELEQPAPGEPAPPPADEEAQYQEFQEFQAAAPEDPPAAPPAPLGPESEALSPAASTVNDAIQAAAAYELHDGQQDGDGDPPPPYPGSRNSWEQGQQQQQGQGQEQEQQDQQRQTSGPPEDADQAPIRVWIKDPEKVETAAALGMTKTHIVYVVRTDSRIPGMLASGMEVRRRFSDFDALYAHLKQQYRGYFLPALPDKTFIPGSMAKDSFLRLRRADLQAFMRGITLHPVLRESQAVSTFLLAPGDLSRNPAWTYMVHPPPSSPGVNPVDVSTAGLVTGLDSMVMSMKSVFQAGPPKPKHELDPGEVELRQATQMLRELQKHLEKASETARTLCLRYEDVSTELVHLGRDLHVLSRFDETMQGKAGVSSEAGISAGNRAADLSMLASAATMQHSPWKSLGLKTAASLVMLHDHATLLPEAVAALEAREAALSHAWALEDEQVAKEHQLVQLQSSARQSSNPTVEKGVEKLKARIAQLREGHRLALEQHATLTERNRVELRRLHLEREADTRRMVALFARTQAALVQASAAAWAECAAQFEAAA